MTALSVIIPAFNAARTIGATLASVLAQTSPVSETIVVDDGSTDETAAVASEYPDVTVIKRPNGGPAGAMNDGVLRASGDILAFVDADDLWPRDNIAAHRAFLSAHSEADATLGWVEEFIDPDLDVSVAASIRPRPPYPGWLSGAMVLRRSVLQRVGPFDPKLKVGHWIDWIDRARHTGAAFRQLEHVALRRRLRPGTLSSSERRDHDLLEVARLALSRRRQADGP